MGVRKDCCCEGVEKLERILRNHIGETVGLATTAGDAKLGTIRNVFDGLLFLEDVVAFSSAFPYIPVFAEKAIVPICQVADVLFNVGDAATFAQTVQNFNANRGS